ncbi:MAG: carbohydrate ABC transporter permease, partial [Clostridiales bacterium]|nr:carbohydrate ABC transporter permease [Clostridiales bacterium]
MYFGGGLIPLFVMINNYGLYNTRWAVLVTSGLSTWNAMVMISFFKALPRELEEACNVDGASELTTLVRVILPLSKPILATISLFYAVGQWNAWFNSYIFLSDKQLYPIQLVLRNLMATIGTGLDMGDVSVATQAVGSNAENINPTSLNYALTVAVVAPILFVYPFVQKYFVKGVMVGSLKG